MKNGQYDVYTNEEKSVLTQRYNAFLEEYEALCKKHNAMVWSEGEEVWVGNANEDLWGVRETTMDRIENDRLFQ